MKINRFIPLVLTLVIVVSCQSQDSLPLRTIKLPGGFKIEVYAENVPDARSLALSPGGVLFVGSRDAGKVYALPDENKDNRADAVLTIAEGLNSPNGVAFNRNDLYVAEIDKIWRYADIDGKLENPGDPVLVSDRFPGDGHHGWKFIRFGPDGMLYVPVGAPCNVCEADSIYATITRMQPDGSGFGIFAHGIRNTVGFDWHPQTGELWFTENGRDLMGDEIPPDELNVAPKPGMHFGYPFCHGQDIPDPEFGEGRDCDDFTRPKIDLGPHVAAVGMRFYNGEMFPQTYRKQIFIAEHGSWNRSSKIGYRVMLVRLENNKAVSYEVFAEGWLQGEDDWGRPVDVLVMPDGALLVSDDKAGAIYRISYAG